MKFKKWAGLQLGEQLQPGAPPQPPCKTLENWLTTRPQDPDHLAIFNKALFLEVQEPPDLGSLLENTGSQNWVILFIPVHLMSEPHLTWEMSICKGPSTPSRAPQMFSCFSQGHHIHRPPKVWSPETGVVRLDVQTFLLRVQRW